MRRVIGPHRRSKSRSAIRNRVGGLVALAKLVGTIGNCRDDIGTLPAELTSRRPGVQTARFTTAVLLLLALTTAVAGQGFKIYPGATKYTPPDTEQTREAQKALPPGTVAMSYLTNDSFERVVAFYKGFAQEYTMPGMPKGRKLPNGQELKQTYFIFDGAKDLTTSKSWAQIQRPLIGSIDDKLEPHEIRDVTVINVSQKK